MNIRGLNIKLKYEKLWKLAEEQKADVISLSETKLTKILKKEGWIAKQTRAVSNGGCWLASKFK